MSVVPSRPSSMRSRGRRAVLAVGAAALLGLSPAATPAASAADGPALDVTFQNGQDTSTVAVPEYRAGVGGSSYLSVVVHNTGTEDLVLQGLQMPSSWPANSPCTGLLPVGQSVTCTVGFDAGAGTPGTQVEVPITVLAQSALLVPNDPWGTPEPGAPILSDTVTLTKSYYDVQPQVMFVSAWGTPSPVSPGETITYTVSVTRSPADGPRTRVSSLTSDLYGNLLDPDNPVVSSNSCPALATTTPGSCTFTVIAPTGSTTLADTLTAVFSDGTGPTVTMTAPTSVTVQGIEPATADTWAQASTPWPVVTVNGVTLTRSTRTADVLPLGRCAAEIPATLGEVLSSPVGSKGGCTRQWRLAKAAVVTLLNEAADSTYPAPAPDQILADTAQALSNGPRSASLAAIYEGWLDTLS